MPGRPLARLQATAALDEPLTSDVLPRWHLIGAPRWCLGSPDAHELEELRVYWLGLRRLRLFEGGARLTEEVVANCHYVARPDPLRLNDRTQQDHLSGS